MTIIDDYFNYYKKYNKIYGNRTVILMQVGSFFELYETTKGELITNNLKTIKDIPHKIRKNTVPEEIEIRVEVFIEK